MAAIHFARALQPYCGAPPAPATLWLRWNLDPMLVVALLLALAGLWIASRLASPRPRPAQTAVLLAGWATAALALISPLCALSVSLAAARAGQHMALAAVAAPLIAWGLPRRAAAPGEALAAAAVFGIVLWVWQAPSPYAATFRNPAIYWAMHVSAFGAALWLWSALWAAGARRLGEAMASAAFTSLQMALLGAILTFSGRPLYDVYATTTFAWGLSPLADQQLAGAIMWAPAGAILAAAVVSGLTFTLRDSERRAEASVGRPGLAR